MIDLSVSCTQKAFGDLVGISQPAVSDLLTRGVLQDGAVAGQWLLDYCGHLREVAAGRVGDGDVDLVTERALLAREQREKIAMQNAVTRGELAPVILIEQVLAKAASKVAGILDAIPGMVRRRVPDLPADGIDLIAGEISKARNIAAAMSLTDLVEAEQEQTASTEEGLTLLEDES